MDTIEKIDTVDVTLAGAISYMARRAPRRDVGGTLLPYAASNRDIWRKLAASIALTSRGEWTEARPMVDAVSRRLARAAPVEGVYTDMTRQGAIAPWRATEDLRRERRAWYSPDATAARAEGWSEFIIHELGWMMPPMSPMS